LAGIPRLSGSVRRSVSYQARRIDITFNRRVNLKPFLITRTASTLFVGLALLGLLCGATCEGTALIAIRGFDNGDPNWCTAIRPSGQPSQGEFGDILQLANANNVNDFFQCQVTSSVESGDSRYFVNISPTKAGQHPFAVAGAAVIVDNLSR